MNEAISPETGPRAGGLLLIVGIAVVVGGLALGGALWFSRSSGSLTRQLSERTAEQARTEGKEALRRDDYPAAMEAFARAVERSPEPNAQLLFELSLATEKSGEYELAATRYAAAVERAVLETTKFPDRALFVDPFVGLAGIYQRLGTPEEESAVWRRLLELDAKQYPAYFRLGVILAAQGRHEESAVHLEQCIRYLPESHKGGNIEAKCTTLLGDIYLGGGNHAEALHAYQRAFAIQPHDQSLEYKIRLCRERIDGSIKDATGP